MKKIIIFAIITFTVSGVFAQNWAINYSNSTASLKPKGKWETGFWQPLRIGITDKLELNTHFWVVALNPELGAKIGWGEKAGWKISSEHDLSMPSVLLNFISREDMGGIISPEYNFKTIVSLYNGAIASKPFWNNAVLTTRAGFAFALRGEKPDPQATIDLPVFYPRMAHYYEGVSLRAGASVLKPIGSRLAVEEKIQLYYLTRSSNNFFAENTGTIMWRMCKRTVLKGGYILNYGTYPFGNHLQMWPVIDLVFGSKFE